MISRLSVVTPATSADLVSLAETKAVLGVDGSDDDALIQIFITQASDALARFCKRVFAHEGVKQSVRTEDGDAIGHQPVVLRRRPVELTGFGASINGVAVEAGRLEVDPSAGLLWLLDEIGNQMKWPARASVEITYSAGYSLPTGTPAALKRACILLVNHYRASTARDPLLKGETVEGVGRMDYAVTTSSGETPSGLPSDVEALALPFRQVAL